ncbi:hypothetical protein ACQPXS_46790 (plasmid) [Streptomyces sp. CA-142005]|uniref:hypothetical protein n=1 Tax=Streptomyces sp. CA-142005 TaxID=3240052 RepID=UPI003D93D764
MFMTRSDTPRAEDSPAPTRKFAWDDYAGRRPPRGWPGSVPSPDSARFPQVAKGWLFTLAPARWQYEPVLHRFPALLARMVRFHLESGMAGAAVNCRTARSRLQNLIPESAVEEFIQACAEEYRRMQLLSLQVKLAESELKRVCDCRPPEKPGKKNGTKLRKTKRPR